VTAEAVESRLRRFLLLLATFSLAATSVELWLEEHTKEALQFIPFFLCGVGLVTLVASLLYPHRATLIALRIAMSLVALGGVVGTVVHLLKNFEFEREIRPGASTGDVFVAALKGASPLLAPGVLLFAALVALAATYYHPAIDNRETL
jgi:prepilin signal peptidase PulO-like enzyme (type II secretory pathway)